MENIINNPGLQHLIEKMFLNLNYEDFKKCQIINKSAKNILGNSMFWIKKLIQRGLSKNNQIIFIKAIQSVKNSDMEKSFLLFLKWNLKTEERVGFPLVPGTPIHWAAYGGFTEVVKILVPLTDNPSAPNEIGKSALNLAAENGHTEIVKILAPVTKNLNKPDGYGNTPIYWAACNGHTEIVKILVPLTDHPNAAANENGATPIYWAARFGHKEIVKILAPLTDNPNVPNRYGVSPLHLAASNGHIEIVKILAPLANNINAPDLNGMTPIRWAQIEGHIEIVKFLTPLS